MRKILFIVGLVLIAATAVWAADLYSNVKVLRAISPITVSNNDNTDSQIIDRLGYQSLTFVISVATVADSDATFTPSLIAGDNSALSDGATVAAGSILGTVASATFTIADNNAVYKLGYTGPKRYVRLRITPASNTGAATFSAVSILGHPKRGPVAQ